MGLDSNAEKKMTTTCNLFPVGNHSKSNEE